MTDRFMALAPPKAVMDIVLTLRRAGHETWCVGGAVRDALMGRANLDWDLATAARPPQVRRLFDRTIPVGIEFGTIGVLDSAGRMHEVTTFRRDVQHDGRHAVVEFGASLDEDLARRDFTINAIAFDPIASCLHDPFDGQADLRNGILRAVGDADARMEEDRLRSLRAIRFASRFNFRIEPSTWKAIVASAPFLPRLSPERVKQEIEKTMEQVACPSAAFRLWRDAGAFASLVPTLADASEAALEAVDFLPLPGMATRPQRRVLRVAALLSDGTGRAAEQTLRNLRFSNADIAWVSALVERWHQDGASLGTAIRTSGDVPDEMLRRLTAAVGRLRVSAFTRLAAARWAVERAHGRDAPSARSVRTFHRRALRCAFRDPLEIADLAIDGDDLRSIGVTPGPLYGRILATLLDDVLGDPVRNKREWLMERVPGIVATLSSRC